MGLDLEAIHRGCADTIKAYLVAHGGRDTNVNPFPGGILSPPSITVEPDPSTYFHPFQTIGARGEADVMLRLHLEVVAGDDESLGMVICEYLSYGTGHPSSIVDAVLSDPTFGGVIESCYTGPVEWDVSTNEVYIPLTILATRGA